VGGVLDATVTSVTHAYSSTLLMKAGKDASWGAIHFATRIATVLLATSALAVDHAARVMALAGRAQRAGVNLGVFITRFNFKATLQYSTSWFVAPLPHPLMDLPLGSPRFDHKVQSARINLLTGVL